jgi:hypothetical protein
MNTQRQITSIATLGLLVVSTSATRFVVADSHAPRTAQGGGAPAACTLLTTVDATKALEAPSQPGKTDIGPTMCIWSNDPAASDSSRKVAVNTHSLRAFQFAKSPKITVKIEPVSGIGDEAFYQIYPHDQSPFIWVRKGNNAISIRILIGSKPKPFTLDQERAKEALLAKAAVAKL